MGYTHVNADSIKSAIRNITGYTMPFAGGASNGSYSSFTNQDNIHARIYFVKGNFSQARIVFKTEEVVDIPVKVKFKKVDTAGKSIEGAKIEVKGSEDPNIEKITGRDNYQLTSGSNGSFGTIKVHLKENTGEFKLRLKETKIPIGYTGTTEYIYLTVRYNKNTYKVTEIKSSNTTYVPNATSNTANVVNYSKPINIKKVNFNGNNMSDINFVVYFNNIDSVKIEGTTIDLRELRTEKRRKDSSGNYPTVCELIGNTGYGYWTPKGDDWNNVYIFGVKPGDKITDIVPASQNTSTIHMVVHEKRPEEYAGHAEVTDEVRSLLKIPKGYSTVPERLRLTFTLQNGKWVLGERNTNDGYNNKLDDKYFAIEANNTIKMINDYQIEELSLIKTNSSNAKLNGAKFNIKVENVRKIGNTTYSGTAQLSNVAITNGQLTLKGLVFNDSTKPIKVTIEETQAPTGYKKINGKMYLTITRNGNNYSVVKTKDNTVLAQEFATGTVSVAAGNAINIGVVNLLIYRIPELGLTKTDTANTKVNGAKFNIKVENVSKIGNTTYDGTAQINNTTIANGQFKLTGVTFKDITQPLKVTIEEVYAPAGYKKINGKMYLTITKNGNNYSIVKTKDNTVLAQEFGTGTISVAENDPVNIGIVDLPQVEQLKIVKKDALNGNKLQGIKFKLTLTNVKSVKGYSATPVSNKIVLTGVETNANGEIILEDLIINNVNNNIEVVIEEEDSDNDGLVLEKYKKINGKIKIVLTRNGAILSGTLNKDNTVLDTEVSTNSLKVNGSANTVALDIKNHEVINLSGQVWLDAQEGEKAPANPDGKKDSKEKKVQGVKVHLYSVKEKKIISTVTTDSNGVYAFNNVIKTNEGFKIYFEYNGILYNDVGIRGDSKAAEIDSERTTFNGRFKTIDVNGANDGTSLTYSYSDKKAILNAAVDGSTPTNSSIKAYTGVYKVTTSNIDCGLTSKYYDLRVDNLINNIEYTINGKTLKENVGEKATTYNASIFYSDYYYRYDDYANLIGEFDDEILRKDTLQTAELEAYVTYKIQIINQNTHTTNNVSVDYTYDNAKYELLSIDGEPKTANGKITLTSTNLTSTNNTKEILIKFKVRKDSEGNLPSEIANSNGLTVETKAEITSYTTQEGALIDVNSQPGNGKDEDDLSKASVNFKLKEDAREISGNVAEDNNSDGILDDNKQINDVVVQLIEIVQGKDGKTYEYIWQETYTGSNQVKARSTSNNVYTYTNKLPASRNGQYQFLGYEVKADGSIGLKTGFIPGNYVIRFIYGDGTTLYAGRTELLSENVAKYNGQDYKSTIDNSYKQEWYSNANYDGKSTARDNEARRLEVMAFSTEIDGGLGVALDTLNKNSFADLNSEEKQLLKDYYASLDKNSLEVKFAYRASKGEPYDTSINIPESLSDEEIFKTVKYYASYKTWMCAETSKINVGEAGDKFTNVNFGLMERPKTNLVLEKHITALKITPNGTGVQPVVDAKADINQILEALKNDEAVNKTGITNGLSVIASDRTNRGFWKVETDIEELMQGAKLEVEYTYVIKNDSDEDYLNEFLVSSFENLTSADYKALLLNKINEVNANNLDKGLTNGYGEWLGQFYYTGTKGSHDKPITAKADKLEQSINNNLLFNEGIAGESFVKASENVPKNIYDKDGNVSTEQIATIVQTATPTINLEKGNNDYSKVLRLETTLASSNNGEIGTTIPSYIAEIAKYSNAAGRENIEAVPENLSYVHSDDTDMTMSTNNEIDEFWGESIIISKPTGADKNTAIIITIIAISGVAVIGVGIILIKKFAIKK